MSYELNKILESWSDFYETNQNIVLGVGFAVLAVIVIACVISSRRRAEAELEAEAAERTRLKEETVEAEKENVAEEETLGEEDTPAEEVRHEAEELTSKKPESEVSIAEHKLEEADKQAPVTDVPVKIVTEKLINDIAKASDLNLNNLESIEIKIANAEIVMHYGNNRAVIQTEAQSTGDDEIRIHKIIPRDSMKQISMETEKCESAPNSDIKVKKFGADNFNVSRSGKTYNEDELRNQILD